MVESTRRRLALTIGGGIVLVLGTLGVAIPSAKASGKRGTTVTKQMIEARFIELKESAIRTLGPMNYIGSTSRWHAFLQVKTLFPIRRKGGKGRPWSKLSMFKVSVQKATVFNGWQIQFPVGYIRAARCPVVSVVSKKKKRPIKMWVPKRKAGERRCGTESSVRRKKK